MRCKACSATSGQTFRGQGVNAVTDNDCLLVRLGNGHVQSVKERCGHLAHSLGVGKQPVHINNLAEREDTVFIA